MSNISLVDDPADLPAAARELAAMGAAEDAKDMQYEADLLKGELYRVLRALYEQRIDFATAVAACRLLGNTADNLILSQQEAEELWALWQDNHITYREMIVLAGMMQDDKLRAQAEMSGKLAKKAPNRGEHV